MAPPRTPTSVTSANTRHGMGGSCTVRLCGGGEPGSSVGGPGAAEEQLELGRRGAGGGAAVDRERDAGDLGAAVAGEEEGRLGDVVDAAGAGERLGELHDVVEVVGALVDGGGDLPRNDAVDPDPV